MEKWMIYAKKADFHEIGNRFGIDPVTVRVIRNRDVIGEKEIESYLYGSIKDLYSPFLMKDMDKAVHIISEKIGERKKIRIIGDYDIDGVNASYILQKALTRCGAAVDVDIPERVRDGYGVNIRLIEKAAEEEIDTLITCDNGIAAINPIQCAKELGMTVIVTDHHEISYEDTEHGRTYHIPNADAVVNPKQEDCTYPYKGLCGAAVAYKLVEALYQEMGIPKEETEELLEFAAIATVGDVMELLGENRILVKEGLKRLHQTKNMGLRALIQVNGLAPEHINSYHIGFVIGPCLNAGGRLDTALRALRLFNAETIEEAESLAGELKALNDSRKDMTNKGVERACFEIEHSELARDKVLVVYLPECHESLAGIIAGRLREKYYKPVFVLTKGEEGIKGSGRSIEGYSMFDELVKHREYLEKFGGHKMAAGLSLKEENILPFRKALNVDTTLTEEELIPKKWIDVPMPISYLTSELIQQLEILEPYGRGNEKPVFAEKNLTILSKKVVGKNKNAVKLVLKNIDGIQIDAIYFGDGEEFVKNIDGKNNLSVLYYPSINEYKGNETIQIVITGYQ